MASAQARAPPSNTSNPPTTSKQPSPSAGLPTALQSHDIQLRYELAHTTFKTLCAIQQAPTRREVLRVACLATEFRSFPLKQTEKSFFRELNDHTAVPYPLSEPITQPWHKVFLLVQANLLPQGWPNKISAPARKELTQESHRVHDLLDKVLRCIADILGEKKDGRGLSVTLDVLRSVKARVWEGSGMELRQVEGIGPAKMQKLVDADIKTIRRLSKLEFYHIERLLSRNPPFGQQMLHQLKSFPQLEVSFHLLGEHKPQPTSNSALGTVRDGAASSSSKQLWKARVLLRYLNVKLPAWRTRHPWVTFVVEGEDGRLVWFWRGSVKRLVGRKELIIAIDVHLGETIQLTFACEEIVGTLRRETCKIG